MKCPNCGMPIHTTGGAASTVLPDPGSLSQARRYVVHGEQNIRADERARVIKSVREWMGARSINDIGWQYKLTNLLDYLEANEPEGEK